MAKNLTATTPADTYRDLLHIDNFNRGLEEALQSVFDGEGNESPLQISQDKVNIAEGFHIEGVQVRLTPQMMNILADIFGGTKALDGGTFGTYTEE